MFGFQCKIAVSVWPGILQQTILRDYFPSQHCVHLGVDIRRCVLENGNVIFVTLHKTHCLVLGAAILLLT